MMHIARELSHALGDNDRELPYRVIQFRIQYRIQCDCQHFVAGRVSLQLIAGLLDLAVRGFPPETYRGYTIPALTDHLED